MSWEWISNQALPIAMFMLFIYGLRSGEIYTKTSYGLVTKARDEYKAERDEAIEKMDSITREQAESQAEERAALMAKIAMLETQLADVRNGRERRHPEGAP